MVDYILLLTIVRASGIEAVVLLREPELLLTLSPMKSDVLLTTPSSCRLITAVRKYGPIILYNQYLFLTICSPSNLFFIPH